MKSTCMVQLEEVERTLIFIQKNNNLGQFCGIMEYWGKTFFPDSAQVHFEGSLITRHGGLIQK